MIRGLGGGAGGVEGGEGKRGRGEKYWKVKLPIWQSVTLRDATHRKIRYGPFSITLLKYASTILFQQF